MNASIRPPLAPFDMTELSALGSLPLRARRLADAVGVGHHRSRRKGASVEFADYRDYQFGDDLRRIDSLNPLPFKMSLARGTSSMFAFLALALTGTAADVARGGRVGWARLITGSSSWTVHQGNDPLLAASIRRQTSLNIDPQCYPVTPAHITELCRYPFIFTNNLTNVRDPEHLANLREYLRRGGFIYIDRCVNLSFSLPQEPFYERHIELFARFLPGSEVRELSDDHEIFRCYFSLQLAEIKHRQYAQAGHNRIYGVFDDGRMVALLSLANFQCGWPQSGDKGAAAMRMIANIYVYAMTHGAGMAPLR